MSQPDDGVPITTEGVAPKRSSIEKPPLLMTSDFDDFEDENPLPSAFERLPEEIIQQ